MIEADKKKFYFLFFYRMVSLKINYEKKSDVKTLIAPYDENDPFVKNFLDIALFHELIRIRNDKQVDFFDEEFEWDIGNTIINYIEQKIVNSIGEDIPDLMLYYYDEEDKEAEW